MIEITTFGGFQLTVNGREISLTNRKTQALLIYLASHSDHRHERAILADLFWPELPEASGLNNLSKALGQLRKAFKKAEKATEPFELTRNAVQLSSHDRDRHSSLWQFDARLFVQLVEQTRNSGEPAERAAYLEQAVALYQGEFLAGLALEDCPTFEGWLLLRRENLMLMARESYQRLADHYLASGGFGKAREFARQQLVLDPWHEEGYRQLMRALDGMGLRSDALAQYESCREILRSELGVEPEWATKTLYEQIKEGRARIIDAKGLSATSQLPILRLPKQLIPLVGREQEIDKLREDITNPACRMITIVGAGGVGKTSLALDVAWQAVRDFNDGACFVPLESLQASAGEDLQGKLAAAIGVALELTFSGIDAIYQQLYRYLSD
ncbi:MAG: BTAD domain-containing putative transcriptional regulator, partial [Chloroflexota bacterium]